MSRSVGRRRLAVLALAGTVTLAAHPVAAHQPADTRLARVGARILADPANPGLYLERGELRRERGEWSLALADFDRAASLAPGRAEVDLHRGRVLLEAGRLVEAGEALVRLLGREPGNVDGLATLARVRAGQGEPLAAAAAWDRMLAAVPPAARPAPDAYVERARALVAAGPPHLARALDGLDQGIARLGRAAELELYAVEIEAGLGRWRAALNRLDRLADLSPRKDPWLVRRAALLERAGCRSAARAAYSAALGELAGVPEARRLSRQSSALEAEARSAIARLDADTRPEQPADPEACR